MITMNENTYNHINLEYMDMMSDGDESMKKIMLEMLLEELPQEVQKMQELLVTQQWNDLGSVSHKLKSTLAFVGNPSMTAANRDIELMAKEQKELDRIPELVQILHNMYPKALEELKMVHAKL